MAGCAADVARIAGGEVGTNWIKSPDRILEYYAASSGGMIFTQSEALKLSWCTFFCMWVLGQAGIVPLPMKGLPSKDHHTKNFSCARFFNSEKAASYGGETPLAGWIRTAGAYSGYSIRSNYVPKAGDLYYLPKHKDHIGIIEEVRPDGLLVTVNGNDWQDEHPEWSLVDPVTSKSAGIGAGCVTRKGPPKYGNIKDGKLKHQGAMYIEIPG